MSRKPYQAPMPANWWLKNPVYRFYMLREATVLPLLFFVGCLLYGLYSLAQGEAHWQGWLDWMRTPWVVMGNLLALAASLLHAFTFFRLFPKVLPIRLAGRTLPASVMIAAQWLAVLVCLVLLWWLMRG